MSLLLIRYYILVKMYLLCWKRTKNMTGWENFKTGHRMKVGIRSLKNNANFVFISIIFNNKINKRSSALQKSENNSEY